MAAIVDFQEQTLSQSESVKFTLVSTTAHDHNCINSSRESRPQEIISLNLIMKDNTDSSSYPSFSFTQSFEFDDDSSRSEVIAAFTSCNESDSPLGSESSFSNDDTMDDEDEDDHDSSSSPDEASSSSSSNLFDLSELMSKLPIKRGLSKFYNGKSQSFKSLARVTSLEDLAKSSTTTGGYGKRIKACKSYAAGLSNSSYKSSNLSCYSPKATISKKSSKKR